jgi:DNA-binding IclR family transcriptional regulator
MQDMNETFVPAVGRVLDIMEYIAKNNEPVNSKELADALGIPPTSVFRLIKQLLMRGYLEEDPRKGGSYRLGLQILVLSSAVLQANDLRSQALPIMKRLAATTGQTVQLGVLNGDKVMYIEQSLPTDAVGIVAPLYSVLPINVSAAGKMLAANLPDEILLPMLKKMHLPKHTEKTVTDRDKFLGALRQVKEDGFATDDEEFSIGVGCLAAPVPDHNNHCTASLCITGYIHDYRNPLTRRTLLQSLTEAAGQISRKLGNHSAQ